MNAGHFIAIEKVIICGDPAGCANRAVGTVVAVAEWPVVPLPATLPLIASGLLATLALRRRRR